MSNKTIAWERWDEDVIAQEVVEDLLEPHQITPDYEDFQTNLAVNS